MHRFYQKIIHMEEGYDIVACGGGDGTLDEVVTGMMKHSKKHRVPIGYIPAGTTNDFANSLHISRDVLEAADAIVHGKTFGCDVGLFNDDVFVYVSYQSSGSGEPMRAYIGLSISLNGNVTG